MIKIIVPLITIIAFSFLINSAYAQTDTNQSQSYEQNVTKTFGSVNASRMLSSFCISGSTSFCLTLDYQSPQTVVVEGPVLTLSSTSGNYVNNGMFWTGVDMLKSQGYKIDSVIISGLGTSANPEMYHVIMSKK